MSTAPLLKPAPAPSPRPLNIAGNASYDTKRICLEGFAHIVGARDRDGFAHDVGKRVLLTQVDVTPRPEEPIRSEARVVCELIVEPGAFPPSPSAGIFLILTTYCLDMVV